MPQVHRYARALAHRVKHSYAYLYRAIVGRFGIRHAVTRHNIRQNRGRQNRRLELGPGDHRIDGFETLNIVPDPNVDYILDATEPLPFEEGTFDTIYASHILEHVAWYQVQQTLNEWVRVLKSGGMLEIWVPNGLEICRVFVDYETLGEDRTHLDGWYRFNDEKDPCKWAAGRIFTYGEGDGRADSPNWHRSLFSPRYLRRLFREAGLVDIAQMERSEVRGYDHGWINLGMRGRNP